MKWAHGTQPIVPTIGELVGDYRICAQIGIGGMGIVYEARRLAEEPPVALKVLLPERLADDRALRRFHDEAIAGSLVEHENLAATLAHGETPGGIPFLVMERLRGEPLGAEIHREGTLSLRRAIGIARQILAGLDALHSTGLVHGDVKSDNVLLEHRDGEDRVQLIDFGLAHVQFCPGDVRRPDPEDELVSGTPEYMAPEVIRGEGSSVASDLYAVGVILYELITGATPFGDGAPGEIVQRHLFDPVVPPSLRRPGVPAILERVVLRSLEKDPARRFASARTFASALAITLPVVDETPSHPASRLTRETPTLEWTQDDNPKRRRVARGTPRCKSRR